MPTARARAARPGAANFFKAGASSVVPEPQRTGYIELPVDNGIQGNSGTDMVVISDLATPENTAWGPDEGYVRKTVETWGNTPIVRSDAAGRLWLIAGTDSRFEGITTHYFRDGRFHAHAVMTPGDFHRPSGVRLTNRSGPSSPTDALSADKAARDSCDSASPLVLRCRSASQLRVR